MKGGRYDCETGCSLAIAVSVEIADGGQQHGPTA